MPTFAHRSPEHSTLSPPRAFVRHGRRKLRIALAEDDTELRHILSLVLAADGHLVETFSSGGGLVEHLTPAILDDYDALRPDLIVTDVRMPGFNGLAVVEGLRSNGWRTPVIVISAFADSAMRERVERIGDAALFPKPFDPVLLERHIDEISRRV